LKKILVIPNSIDNLDKVLKTSVDGIILPIKGLSVNSSVYFNIEDIKNIINRTSKEVCVSINKIMHNDDLEYLENVLISLNKLNVSKILFYDLSVMHICKKLGIRKNLCIFQDHLNTSLYSTNFYAKRGIKNILITNDITMEEINVIGDVNSLMLICYGYLPIFYSRRYLISSYLDYVKLEKNSNHYYIKNREDKYPILEEESGTTIYSKRPINLINYVNSLNIEYVVLNATLIDNEEFMRVLDNYLCDRYNDEDHYTGFLNRKTVYKVEDYE
jgi:putative protease